MVLTLVLLPALAEVLGGRPLGGHADGSHGLLVTLAVTLGKVGAFVAIALSIGPRVMPWLLRLRRFGVGERRDLSGILLGIRRAAIVLILPGSTGKAPSVMSSTPSPEMSSPFLARALRMAKMISCLRDRAVPSIFRSWAMAITSAADFFFSSVRFM